MAQTKTAPVRKTKNKPVADVLEEETVDPKALKGKKPIELDLPDEPLPIVDDKVDEDGSLGTDEADESSGDEAALDDDELNPFGDKWEQ